jgi:hypothetical protein
METLDILAQIMAAFLLVMPQLLRLTGLGKLWQTT